MTIKHTLLDCTDFQQIHEKHYNADLFDTALILFDLLPLSKRLVYTINFLTAHFILLCKPIFLHKNVGFILFPEDWLFWEHLISLEMGPFLWESFDPTGGSTPFHLKLKSR